MIKINSLTKKIDDNIIFENLDLEIPENKISFIIGNSGVGKTTLINLIAGFIEKDEGQILFFKNNEILKKPLIDVVFQDFNLINEISIENNIAVASVISKRQANLKTLENQANFLGLDNEKLKQKVGDLSTGEKQRVAVLRAFSRDSDFILLDEPTGNLDEENAISVFDALKKISINKTVLVVSHNLELAKKYADRIILIEQGKVRITENTPDSPPTELLEKSQENKDKTEKSTFFQKVKIAFLLAFVDIKTKFLSTILTIFLFLLLIFAVVLFANLNITAKNVNYPEIKKLNLDSVIISNKNFVFQDSDIEQIKKNNLKIQKILPEYNANPQISFFLEDQSKNKIFAKNNIILTVDESDFFKNRFSFDNKNIEGNFIKNENEIILSIDTVNELKIDNPIGKKINIFYIYDLTEPGKYLDTEAIIVGVYHKKVIENFTPSLVHWKKLKTLIEKTNNKTKPFTKIGFFDKKYTSQFSLATFPPNLDINKTYFDDAIDKNKFKIISGRLPKAIDEIAISSNFNLDITNVFAQINSKFDGNNFKLKIVGTFEEKSNDQKSNEQQSVILNYKIKEISDKLFPTHLRLYFDNKDLYNNIDQFVQKYKEGSEQYYWTRGGLQQILSQMINSQFTMLVALFSSVIIFAIILFVIISFYAKNLSNLKQKSIGIFKALGAKTAEIFLYHWLTLIIISVLVLIFGMIFSVPIIPEIYKLISGQEFAMPSYSQIAVLFLLVWSSMFVIMSVLYMLISIKTYRKKVVNLLK
ncbi:ATP-binding cassette domain-containing protein [Mesomycoplasma dispar]|uniref:ABC transporter ATP-binding protein n=1 Tax=Mesomycoplasma dispar TaxID=86660 RepID=A0ABN5DRT3_9BACT|nr:ATP-binding cassette domain-containing protein [Mesomycoplasma dispar]ATP59971.1 ABC transporter ATP-binding protein [Mesomycoplasma dispar]